MHKKKAHVKAKKAMHMMHEHHEGHHKNAPAKAKAKKMMHAMHEGMEMMHHAKEHHKKAKALKHKIHSMSKFDESTRRERGMLRQKVHSHVGKKLKTHSTKDTSGRIY